MSIQVHVTGTSPAAAKLREYLGSLGFALAESGARYAVRIDEASDAGNIALEGIRGALAEETQHAVAELSGAAVEWRRSINGNEGSVRMAVGSPHEDAAARGALRAILRLTRHGEPDSWLKRMRGRKTI